MSADVPTLDELRRQRPPFRSSLTVEYGYIRPRWKRGRKYIMTAERGWPGRGWLLYRIVARYQLGTLATTLILVGWAWTRGQAEAAVWALRSAALKPGASNAARS